MPTAQPYSTSCRMNCGRPNPSQLHSQARRLGGNQHADKTIRCALCGDTRLQRGATKRFVLGLKRWVCQLCAAKRDRGLVGLIEAALELEGATCP